MALEVVAGLFLIRCIIKRIKKNKIKKERIRLDKYYEDNLLGVYKGTIQTIQDQFPEFNIYTLDNLDQIEVIEWNLDENESEKES